MAYKKGLMQQLFPLRRRNHAATQFPEFRKGGMAGAAGGLGRLISGLTYSPSDVRREGLLVLRSSNIRAGHGARRLCIRDARGQRSEHRRAKRHLDLRPERIEAANREECDDPCGPTALHAWRVYDCLSSGRSAFGSPTVSKLRCIGGRSWLIWA